MQQHELRQPAGATHRRKRVGRGNASGHGTYSGKGLKGQKARAGGGVRPGFEGGQLPLIRRMARKRGFRNPFRVDYEEVNVGQLDRLTSTEVTAQTLVEARLIRSIRKPVKILGEGEITKALTVEATRFSSSARAKIEAAGGSVRWLNGEPPTPEERESAKRAARAETPRAKRRAKAEGASAQAKAPVSGSASQKTEKSARAAPKKDETPGGDDGSAAPEGVEREGPADGSGS